MKKIFLLLVFVCLGLIQQANAQQANKIIGTWLTSEKDGKIEIYQQNGKYYGKLVWGQRMFEADGKTSKKDVKNPDAKLQKRDLQNLVLLTDFVFDDGKWEDGKIYDSESGKTYSCVMKFEGEKLKITGYIGVSWLGRTVIWTRIQ